MPGQILALILVAFVAVGGFLFYQNNQSISVSNRQGTIKSAPPKTASYKGTTFIFSYAPKLTARADSEEEYSKRNGGDARKNFSGYVQYQPPKFLEASAVLNFDQNIDKSPFTVWVFDNPSNLSEADWYDKYWYYPYLWGQFNLPEKQPLSPKNEATVSGRMAHFGLVDYQFGSPKYYYLSSQSRMYLIRILATPDNAGEQALSSFKLIP